jgi:hypothetical protein
VWIRSVRFAKKSTRRLTPRKNTAAMPAPSKQTKENNGTFESGSRERTGLH